jgi:hypothetical protein
MTRGSQTSGISRSWKVNIFPLGLEVMSGLRVGDEAMIGRSKTECQPVRNKRAFKLMFSTRGGSVHCLQYMNTLHIHVLRDTEAWNTLKNSVFCDVTPCGCCKDRRFGETYRLHHQAENNQRASNSTLAITSNWSTLHSHSLENLKSYIKCSVFC